jgi:hypothetical protein
MGVLTGALLVPVVALLVFLVVLDREVAGAGK